VTAEARLVSATFATPFVVAMLLAAEQGVRLGTWLTFVYMMPYAALGLLAVTVLFVLPVVLLLRRLGHASLAACTLAGLVVFATLALAATLAIHAAGVASDYPYSPLGKALMGVGKGGLLGAFMGALFRTIAFSGSAAADRPEARSRASSL